MMNQGQRVISMAALAGLLGALVLAGCATKNVAVTTAGNPTTPGQAETKAAGNAPLKGFSKNPVEEQVTQPAPMVMARSERRLSRRSPEGAGGPAQRASHPIISRTIGTTFRP